MANRELRPGDSLSMQSPAERAEVARLIAGFSRLTPTEQAGLPALRNGLAKLRAASGDLKGAQEAFAAVAAAPLDAASRAEVYHNAHLTALARKDWPAALNALCAAASLDPARFRPFDLQLYEPLQILGAGGFGVAFLCRHCITGGLRVLKTIRTDGLGSDRVAQIIKEAQTMEHVKHEAVITLYECNYADAGRRARPYLAMEHFDAKTLADVVARDGPLGQKEATDLARRIADGLLAAHQRGILHRDIKPGNVLAKRTADGWRVKIIDFGLALRGAEDAAASRMATVHEAAGTLDYAAPEQFGRLAGTAVDSRADVYGFGRTICFALFGTPNPIGRQWRSLTPTFASWLDSCIEEKPQDRPANFAQVIERLAKVSAKGKPKNTGEVKLPTLVTVRGRNLKAEYPLQEGSNVVGREGADVDLDDQEPPDRCFISQQHCVITLEHGVLAAEDPGSANGTFVNRQRLASGERRPLKADDVIQIGNVTLKVRW